MTTEMTMMMIIWWRLCRQHDSSRCIISCRSSGFDRNHNPLSIYQVSCGSSFRFSHFIVQRWIMRGICRGVLGIRYVVT